MTFQSHYTRSTVKYYTKGLRMGLPNVCKMLTFFTFCPVERFRVVGHQRITNDCIVVRSNSSISPRFRIIAVTKAPLFIEALLSRQVRNSGKEPSRIQKGLEGQSPVVKISRSGRDVLSLIYALLLYTFSECLGPSETWQFRLQGSQHITHKYIVRIS